MNKSAAKKMKQRSAGKPDIELGKRIRLRRVEQKISQAELGEKREKREAAKAKKREELQKQLEEQQQAEGGENAA